MAGEKHIEIFNCNLENDVLEIYRKDKNDDWQEISEISNCVLDKEVLEIHKRDK